MRRLLVMAGLVVVLLTACARNSVQQGTYDGVSSAMWAGGYPTVPMRFDKARYVSDAEYRDGFDTALRDRLPFFFPYAGQAVRDLLRLDELRAQAEAQAAGRPTP